LARLLLADRAKKWSWVVATLKGEFRECQ
jgi:hypothetical protein